MGHQTKQEKYFKENGTTRYNVTEKQRTKYCTLDLAACDHHLDRLQQIQVFGEREILLLSERTKRKSESLY